MPDLFSTSISPSAKKLLQEKVFGVLPPSYSPAPTNPQDWSSPMGTLPEEPLQLPEDSLAELRKWFIGQQNQSTELAKSGSLRLGVSPAAVEQALIGRFDPAELGVNALDHIIKTYGRPTQGVEDSLSMIPTLKNLGEFMRRMKQARAYDIEKFPESGLAEKFIHARYPKLSAQLFPLKVHPQTIFNSGTAGAFSAKDNVTHLINQGGYSSMQPRTAFDMTNTLAHEGTHARDFRNPVSVVPKDQFYIPDEEVPGMPGVKGTYITPEESRKQVGNLSLYENQLVEERARQAGATAGDQEKGALKQFLDLLPDAVGRRQNFTINSNSTPHEIERATSLLTSAEKIIKRDYPKDEADKYIKILRERKAKVAENINRYVESRTYLTKKPPEKPYFEYMGDALYGSSLPHPVLSRLRNQMNFPLRFDFQLRSPDEQKITKLIKDFQAEEGIGNITAFMKKLAEQEANTGNLPKPDPNSPFWKFMKDKFGEGDVTGKMFPPPAK